MPILIRELSIKITVDEQQGRHPSPAAANASGANGNAKHEIIAECVEQVMDILKAKIEK